MKMLPIEGDYGSFLVYSEMTLAQIKTLCENSRYKKLRGISNNKNEFFIWDAYDACHGDVLNKIVSYGFDFVAEKITKSHVLILT